MVFKCFLLCFSKIFDMLSLHYWFRTHGFQDPQLFYGSINPASDPKHGEKRKKTKIIKNWSKTMVLTKTAVTMSSGTKKYDSWYILNWFSSHGDPFREYFYVFCYFLNKKCIKNATGANGRQRGPTGSVTLLAKNFRVASDLNSFFFE